MSLIKINYNQFNDSDFFTSPFSLDSVGYDIQSTYSLKNGSDTYSDCPSWKHRSNRTFVVRSPIDLAFTVDRSTETLECFDIDEEVFKEYFYPTFESPGGWCNDKAVTIQLTIPRFLFWTKHKNVWIEQRPYALAAVRNNLVCVNGWYNLSNWVRPICFAFDIVDHTQPVIIKRGDVLFELCFYGKNLDDGILLNKKEIPEHVFEKSQKTSKVKKYAKYLSPYLIFKNQTNKCPFEFLWNKTP